MKRFQLLITFLFLSVAVSAQLKVARVFSDHMVLQRNQPVKIWGWAAPKSEISVLFADKIVKTIASDSGKWMADLGTFSVNKSPQKLIVNAGNDTIKFEDILIGDVWLCSGQSNMEWRLKDVNDAQAEIAAANYPLIRHFKVSLELEFTPQTDLRNGEWQVASPKTADEFTAVGYFFARHLQTELDVPIGLLNSSWGGSQVESWISQEAIKNSEELGYYAALMPKSWEEDARNTETKLIKRIYGDANIDIANINEAAYLNPTYDYEKWLTVDIPGQWDWQGKGMQAYRGTAFLQKMIDLPVSFTNEITDFSFGSNSGNFELIVNGKTVLKGFAMGKITAKVPAGTWKEGAIIF